MAYALIPDGFILKKVSKAEKDAVDEYFGRERRGTYFEELLGNPNTPLVVGAVVLIPSLIAILLAVLKEEGVSITDEIGQKLVQTSPAFWLFKVAEVGAEKGTEFGTDINQQLKHLMGGGKFEDLFKR
jgi:hypothetical protein